MLGTLRPAEGGGDSRLVDRPVDHELGDGFAEFIGNRPQFVEQILVPALMLMIREFDPERIAKKNANYQKHYKTLIDPAGGCDPTVYRLTLKAVLKVLEQDFQVTETMTRLSDWSSRPQSVDFLRLVEKEMDIERDANPVNSGCDA